MADAFLASIAHRPDVAAVVIGRNEGERLKRCLMSVLPHVSLVVYVDSGSNDGSPALAAALGAQVHPLDMSRPFTAARARNEGWRLALHLRPDTRFIQFVDGDCEVLPAWWAAARTFLEEQSAVGVVCGRRRELYPQASVYNQLCDWEWDTPVGQAKACGGDALIRVATLQAVGGYRDELIAGEEPELSVRVRAAGWVVWRLPVDMTLHDAAIHHFLQWWKRTQRAGFAFTQGADLHGSGAEKHWVQEARRAWIWGLWLPVCVAAVSVAACAAGQYALAAAAWAVYPLQWMRLLARQPGSGQERLLRATFLLLGKFAEASGGLKYRAAQWRTRGHTLIEYK